MIEMHEDGYDFSNLTGAQQSLLTFQGWAPGARHTKQPRPGTVKKLIDRGLVVASTRPFMGISVPVYEVPLDVHMAWCQHCSSLRERSQMPVPRMAAADR